MKEDGMTQDYRCFKAYDIRGRIPDQLNDEIAYRIGRAFAAVVKPRKVVVGHDIRLSSLRPPR
jgi:phosphomannomutase